MKNVFIVPRLRFFSLGKSTQDGTTFDFNRDKCVTKKNGHSHIMTCFTGNIIFSIETNTLAKNFSTLTNQENNTLFWHQRLGHV